MSVRARARRRATIDCSELHMRASPADLTLEMHINNICIYLHIMIWYDNILHYTVSFARPMRQLSASRLAPSDFSGRPFQKHGCAVVTAWFRARVWGLGCCEISLPSSPLRHQTLDSYFPRPHPDKRFFSEAVSGLEGLPYPLLGLVLHAHGMYITAPLGATSRSARSHIEQLFLHALHNPEIQAEPRQTN